MARKMILATKDDRILIFWIVYQYQKLLKLGGRVTQLIMYYAL